MLSYLLLYSNTHYKLSGSYSLLTLSVNNYSVQSDGTEQVTKVSLRFSAHNCQARKMASLKGKLHTGGQRLVGPPKVLLSFGQVKFACLLSAHAFIIVMFP